MSEKLIGMTDKYLKFTATNSSGDIEYDYAKKIYEDLILVINFHNELYYQKSSPIISDYQYDKLFTFLKDLELRFPDIIRDDSPSQQLTHQIQKEFKKYSHPVPMLSLENTYNSKDLKDWEEFVIKQLQKNGVEIFNFIVQPKFDGISVELIYENGVLTKAITRGDGVLGELVTENAKTLRTIPKMLKDPLNISIRGEVVLPKSSFEKLNHQRTQSGEQLFSNTRNAASGSLRQLDTSITAQRGLKFFPYEIISLDLDKSYDFVDNQDINRLIQYGFELFEPKILDKEFHNIDEIIAICEDLKILELFEKEDVGFDGLVIKLKDYRVRCKIGATNHHPRWAVAYKFPTQQVSTKIISVDFQVSRSGQINPVANLEQVEMNGVKVSRATLHNFDYIKEKDIRYDDYVWVQRSGEVIPYILGPIIERRESDLQPILPPQRCPVCDSEIINLDGEVFYYCSNINCPAVIKEKLIHYVSKDCMDIDGLGEKIIEILVDGGLIKHFSDIYKLGSIENRSNLSALPGMGSKRVSELLNSIESSKYNPLRRLIHALGIRNIGKKTAKDLENHIVSKLNLEEVKDFDYKKFISFLTDKDFLIGIFGIGEKIVDSCINYLNKKENFEIIQELANIGVKFNIFESQPNVEKKLLAGKRFSVTGKFDYSRTKIVKALEEHGAQFDENPTKNTDFLIAGEESGSKLAKAKEYGLKIYNSLEKLKKDYPFVDFEKDNEISVQNKWKNVGLF